MAKLPIFKRLFKNDFEEKDRALIDRLAYIINPFMESLVNSFNKQINIENTTFEYKDIEVTVNASGIPLITLQAKLQSSLKIAGIICIYAENLTTTGVYPVNAPFVTYLQQADIITIPHISGLQANNKYKLRLLVLNKSVILTN